MTTVEPRRIVIIPARYSSTRLPGKPMSLIDGTPMIKRVVDQCKKAKLPNRLIVATDTIFIKEYVETHCKVETIVINDECLSGSDRVYKAYLQLNPRKDDLILNVQGDNPLIDPELIDHVLSYMIKSENKPRYTTAANKSSHWGDFNNSNTVKVTVNKFSMANYFSRHPIPYGGYKSWLRHCGIYGFTSTSLKEFATTKQTRNEKAEGLEQLRILDNGWRMKVVISNHQIGPDVNCPDDLKQLNIGLENGRIDPRNDDDWEWEPMGSGETDSVKPPSTDKARLVGHNKAVGNKLSKEEITSVDEMIISHGERVLRDSPDESKICFHLAAKAGMVIPPIDSGKGATTGTTVTGEEDRVFDGAGNWEYPGDDAANYSHVDAEEGRKAIPNCGSCEDSPNCKLNESCVDHSDEDDTREEPPSDDTDKE